MYNKIISIIVPIYNMEPYIRKCIESIEGQTYRNIEIILVDDGSTDGTGLICDRYASYDSRIKVIHKENGGSVSARKAGLKEAHGDYVMCVDGDDWLEADAVEKALEIGENADMICFAAMEDYESGEYEIKRNTIKEGLYIETAELSLLYDNMLMNGNFFEMGVLPYLWGKVVRTDFLRECHDSVPNIISYAEDVACIFPCLLSVRSVYISNLPLYHYRIHGNSMVNKAVELDKLLVLFRVLQEAFENKNIGRIGIQNENDLRESLLRQLEYYKWQSMLLKGYQHIKSEMCLFPFSHVKEGMSVAIYGAGLFGQVLYQYCEASADMFVVGWFDKKNEIYIARGMNVQSDVTVPETEFDMLVIAILNERLAKRIKENLVMQGIEDEKIDYIHAESLNRVLSLK